MNAFFVIWWVLLVGLMGFNLYQTISLTKQMKVSADLWERTAKKIKEISDE